MNPTAQNTIETLHAEIDVQAEKIAAVHADRLQCRRGCNSCCVDDLTVYEVEANRIRAHHAELLTSEAPHPPGMCAFLDEEGQCRVYELRPYVCRTQGLPLRWLEEDENENIVEFRDICPLNESGPPLEALAEEECWLIGPSEEGLAELQFRADGGRGLRVALRSLFRRLG